MLQGLLDRSRSKKDRAKYKKDLFVPIVPRPLKYLLDIHRRIRRRKGSNGFSIPPIEWPDIGEFQRNSGTSLSSFEIEIIEALDDLYVIEANTKRSE